MQRQVELGHHSSSKLRRLLDQADRHQDLTNEQFIDAMETIVTSFTHLYSGKVRDIYDAGDGRVLFVASDRMSAFDVVMAEPVPDKGRVLTAMTAFWLDQLDDLVPNHLISVDVADFPADAAVSVPGGEAELKGRSMLVRKAEMLPISASCAATSQGRREGYKTSGTMHGTPMPVGLRSRRGCPSRYSPVDESRPDHERTSSFEAACDLIGADLANRSASYRWPPTSGVPRGS